MARYEQRDVVFDVPRHWQDKTLVAFAAPGEPGQKATASFVMTRDELRDGETLRTYADRQLAELGQRVDGFELGATDAVKVGGLDAVSIRFSARTSAGAVAQHLVLVATRRRSIHCFTATTPEVDADQNGPLFERILSTIRFPDSRDDEGESR